MKSTSLSFWAMALLTLLFSACSEPSESKLDASTNGPAEYTYAMSIALTENANAPELQSFAQAYESSEWLLFGGRYNPGATKNGGLHGIHSKSGSGLNYANHGFPPPSFNETAFVYDLNQDKVVAQIDYKGFVQQLEQWSTSLSGEAKNVCLSLLKDTALSCIYQTFRSTNAQVVQEGEFVYVVGGYGTPRGMGTNTAASYQTFPSVAKIHVPSMISAIKGEAQNVTWNKFFRIGFNPRLQATGGELLKIGDVLYLCGGHNFAYNDVAGLNHNQKYLDAVYPFTLTDDTSAGSALVQVTILDTITDIPYKSDVFKYSADTISYLRRRDGPIVPVLFKNGSGLSQGIAYYGGVFKPVRNKSGKLSSPPLAAWNDAVYIYGSSAGNTLSQIKRDTAYQQKNLNVYSCPDFGMYDSVSEKMYTFLPGGIGNGKSDGNLSAFTNTAVHAVLNVNNKTSKPNFIKENIFGADSNYYGAEAVFVPATSTNVQYVEVNNQSSPIIDARNTVWQGDSVQVGYIYGGIEAFIASPGKLVETKTDTIARPGYGKGFSGSTGKIWKVTLIRK